jgi:hypothetical protein
MHSIKNFIKKMNKKSIYCLLIIFMLFTVNSFSQNKKTPPPAGQPSVIKYETGGLTNTANTELSEEALKINSQIDMIKRSGELNSADNINELRRQSEEISNNTVTVNSDMNKQNSVFKKVITVNSDNVTTSQIFEGGYLIASATQVEQRGATAGKIWLIIGTGQGDTGVTASGDSLFLYSSVDNGQSFSLITALSAAAAIKVNRDELDMEIIENTTGTKYLYITLGYTTGGYGGDKKITLLTFDNLGNFNEAVLSIPGYSASSDYFKPRITSDNSTYPSLSYVTVAFMQDSISGPNHNLMSKFYRIYNPYTLTPSVTYFPKSLFTPVPSLSNDFRAQTDIAYFNNSGDTIIFVLSAYPGNGSGVFIYKAHGNTNVYPVYKATLGSVYAGDEIEYARVASNGGNNNLNLMITYSDNYFNINDWDQWIFSTLNAADWTSTSLDFAGVHSSQYGDIVGKRNASGSFNVAYKNTNSCLGSVSSAEIRNNTVSSSVYNLNDNYAFSFLNPKPAFRYVSNDSSLTFWGNYYQLKATGGNNAIRVNVVAAIEGLFDPGTVNHVIEDNISFYLHNNIPPYNAVDSAILHSYSCTLNNAVIFDNAPDGDYYLSVKHRNSLETWSAGPLSLSNGTSWVTYNFVSSSSNSFGNNVMLNSPAWCFYSGDVNQDGVIDLTDVLQIYNDAGIFLTGQYLTTDLNGDSASDLTDLLIAYNNSADFVSVIKP